MDLVGLKFSIHFFQRTVQNLSPKENSDRDLFSLPARTQHSDRSLSNQESFLIPPTLPSPIQDTPDVAPTRTPQSKPNDTTMKEGLTSSKFIDRVSKIMPCVI